MSDAWEIVYIYVWCMHVWVHIYNMYYVWVCMYIVYMYVLRMYVGVHVCVFVYVCRRVFMCMCIHECSVACCNNTDPFGEIQTRCERFGLVFTVDPIARRFEDRLMRWSEDSYWFVQWRSDVIWTRNRVISCKCTRSPSFWLFYFIEIILWNLNSRYCVSLSPVLPQNPV